MYNTAYLHPDAGYEFTNINDLTFTLNGNPYTLGSGVFDAAISNGIVVLQTYEQNPNYTTYWIGIYGDATPI